MKPGEERDFRQFVERTVATLLPAAEALTGERAAATRLVTEVLAELARRWHRIGADPAEEATRLLHHQHPRAGRVAAPPAPEAEADGTPADGTPAEPSSADLATAALEIARRQQRARRRRTGIGAGVAVIAVTAVVVVAGITGLPERSAEAEPPPDLAGHSVVTSFRDGDGHHQLNPETGEYERWPDPIGPVAPDLRSMAILRDRPGDRSALAIVSTLDQEVRSTVDLPHPVSAIAWSPDGAWIVAAAAPLWEEFYYQELAIIDPATGEFQLVPLDLPAGRAATWGANQGAAATGPFWLDPERIAVPTADPNRLLITPIANGSVERPLVDRIGVFDRTGQLLEELPLDTSDLDGDDPHYGLIWYPTGLLDDGRYLLSRTPAPGSFQLVAVEPANLAGPYEPIGFELPESDPSRAWTAHVTGWFDTAVLVDARLVQSFFDATVLVDGWLLHGLTDSQPLPETSYLVDFAPSGLTINEIDLAEQFPLPADLAAGSVNFGDATGLGAAAAHRAFTR